MLLVLLYSRYTTGWIPEECQVIDNVLLDWRRIMDCSPNRGEDVCRRAPILSPYIYAKGNHGSIGLIHVLQIQNFV